MPLKKLIKVKKGLFREGTVPLSSARKFLPRRQATFPRSRTDHENSVPVPNDQEDRPRLKLDVPDSMPRRFGGSQHHKEQRGHTVSADMSDVESDAGSPGERKAASPTVGDSPDDSDAERKAPPPEPPNTADILTEEHVPFQHFQYRAAALTLKEKLWYEENIKVYEYDALDGSNSTSKEVGLPLERVDRQVSMPALAQGTKAKLPTDAFGQLHFQGEDNGLPAWFIRMAVTTSKDQIQELLEKHEVMTDHSRPLRIHCIDYSTWPEDIEIPGLRKRKDDLDRISFKLQLDLISLCNKTAGVILTWSGLAGTNLMHLALGGIVEDSRNSGNFITNLAAIATPPWGAVYPHIQQQLKVKGGAVELKGVEDRVSSADSTPTTKKERARLGARISQYATHFLLLDDPLSTEEPLLTDSQTSNFRHFHVHMIDAMQAYEKKHGSELPVVCILFNGYHDALKMVMYALKKNIPVLVVQGSGGYADIIAEVYTNAVLQTTKERGDNGQIRTRHARIPGEVGEKYLKDPNTRHPLLREIFNSLDKLTVYITKSPSFFGMRHTLDSDVFEALLKHNQGGKFSVLVEIMQQAKRVSQHPHSLITESTTFIDSAELQMDFFIVALKQKSSKVVNVFLNHLKISDKFMEHFHIGRLLRLYDERMYTAQHSPSRRGAGGVCPPFADSQDPKQALIDIRKHLRRLLKKLTVFPIRCLCENCPNCHTGELPTVSEDRFKMRSCLHPVQELFLWSLNQECVEMAVTFWDRCDDKIAAALVAHKVFRSLAKKKRDPDDKWQLEEGAERFQRLAINTLKSCHHMDELITEGLLTKPCPWWGDLSVLQLAIMTSNREFMTQTACKAIMTRIWKGQPPSDPNRPQRRCELVDTDQEAGCCGKIFHCSPVVKYIINFVVQLVFLGLFSYGLLSDLGHGITPIFWALMVWVLAITLEELRQLVTRDPVVSNKNTKARRRHGPWRKVKSYLDQDWNRVDVITILLFWFGMFVFAPYPWLHVFGRFLLSIDIFFFFMRLFQMLMVFDELGLMLVMIYKMIKDTRNFMIILLIFVLSYAVASESLLYPESDLTLARLFHIPRKAYWQVFGELSLEEIELRESESCSAGNQSKHHGYDTPHCPTIYGSYIVPVLLGIHVMITNVLLLNLLIARFGVTFNKVHDEACEHQSWHRCQIITEYYSRTSLPPPINILHGIVFFCWYILRKLGLCCCRVCCRKCCSSRSKDYKQEDIAMGNVNGGGNAAANADDEENKNLLHEHDVRVQRSADKRSMDIFWKSSLPTNSKSNSSGPECYTVEIVKAEKNQTQTPPIPDVYHVMRRRSRDGDHSVQQALAVWNLQPCAGYIIRVADVVIDDFHGECSASDSAEGDNRLQYLLDILEFQDSQAQWVRGQEDAVDPLMTQLKQATDSVRSDLEGIKESCDALTTDIIGLPEVSKGLKEISRDKKSNNKALEKIDKNFNRLNTFLVQDFTSARHELESVKQRLILMDREKDQAISQKQRAEREKDQAISDKQQAEREKDQAVTEKQEADREKDRERQQRQRAEEEREKALQTLTQVREQLETVRREREGELQALRQQQQDLLRQQLRQHGQEQQQQIQDIFSQQIAALQQQQLQALQDQLRELIQLQLQEGVSQ